MTSALCSGLEHEDSWSTDSPLLSENTEDRDFIVSDSETLSDHGDELEEESEDYIPNTPKGRINPIRVIAKRKVVSDGSSSNEYLVLWYSWEAGEAALELVGGLS
ncbi:hypothetical protein BDQ94DRAFT_185040 [Aspergillus welwitschiae]|uniref:Uncharacterized protein n=1 Tax=Aspergillus welwitschiae TaxID=1341132 RepID=A0A3F3PK82_9EURO|nr:hypothetical protein BDQ94DRAFT_185040 [Aspergillus welwitschiae]RDH27298.1 hypothetical protein BDQ94DRAFT_185040 [Aspergillus welwitschiae]